MKIVLVLVSVSIFINFYLIVREIFSLHKYIIHLTFFCCLSYTFCRDSFPKNIKLLYQVYEGLKSTLYSHNILQYLFFLFLIACFCLCCLFRS